MGREGNMAYALSILKLVEWWRSVDAASIWVRCQAVLVR